MHHFKFVYIYCIKIYFDSSVWDTAFFFFLYRHCALLTFIFGCTYKLKKNKKWKKRVLSSSLYSRVYPDIVYYSLRLKANLFSNCSSRQRKVQASFGQSISQKPVSTSFSWWSTLNICFDECREFNPKAAVPVTESYHCLENVNVFLKVLEAI